MRTATRAEIAQMLDWAAAEGWNPGLDDAAAFADADPGGFFVAEQDGQPVAAISVVNHSDSFAFLGLYLCQPTYRGRGIGYALWQHALAHAGTRTVGLDGVAAQQENYARSGFVRTGATTRFEGPCAAPDVTGIRPVTPADLDALATLDRAANGFDRPRFLNAWLTDADTRKTVVQVTGDRLTGFATARLCRQGCKLGPVIAGDRDAALSLAQAAAGALDARAMIIDVPDTQPALQDALRAQGFAATFETARMYKGPAPTAGPGLFAVATLELG
ncbi:GNAT family N-acetyltransferase [Actibacterium ureilyticum]|uniref:GNAT family N-acetyltransferase n=1 Tax=Actibacterium ureilyticum TaxID=1590614 RepID=UPI0031830250